MEVRGGVDKWIKSAVMAAVAVVWTIYMLVGVGKYLIDNVPMPDPAIWGIPGMVWLALNPPIPSSSPKRKREAENE